MSTETESHEFIGWYDGYHRRDTEVAKLNAEIAQLRTMRLSWEALQCRHGCADPVVGIYHAPDGCICFADPIQALCAQHGVKGMQNNNMVLLMERPIAAKQTHCYTCGKPFGRIKYECQVCREWQCSETCRHKHIWTAYKRGWQ